MILFLYFSDFIVFWCFGQLNNSVLDLEYISTSFQGNASSSGGLLGMNDEKFISHSKKDEKRKVKVKVSNSESVASGHDFLDK